MALIIGFDCEQDIWIVGMDLPTEAQLVAHFRHEKGGPLLLELSTAAGTIEVLAPDRIRLKFPAALTRALPTTRIHFDCVRADGAPAYLGFEGEAQFHKTYTELAP